MADSRRTYTGTHVDISYDAVRCRHAAECLRGLPSVFDAKRRPWILPDGADASEAVEVVARCPTGALRTHPKDENVAGEPVPQVTVVETIPGGPLLLHGNLEIGDERETRAALCSCGSSENQPYCDGGGTCAGWPESRRRS
jgi:uncharacterized Fe-S cluster protein YjdI